MSKTNILEMTRALAESAKKAQAQVHDTQKRVQAHVQVIRRMEEALADRERSDAVEQERLQREQRVADMRRAVLESTPEVEEKAPVTETAEKAEAPKVQEAPKAQEPKEEAPAAPQQVRPAQTAAPAQNAPRAAAQQQGERRPYGGQGQQGDRRPYNQGQQGNRPPYNRQGGAPQGERRPYGGQGQQGDRRPYGGQGQQGDRRPYSQGQQGNRPPYNRQGGAPQGERRPYGGQGQQGNRPPFRQGGAGPQRPGGFNRPAPRAAIETPAVEKERVSNYDPNKSNYNRNYDNDRKAKPRKGIVEKGAVMRDDERVRGRRKPKKQAPAHVIEPIKIEHAVITTEMVPIKTLAEKIGKPAGDIIKKLFLIGIMATINQEIDFDTAQLVASEYNITLEQKLEKTYEEVLADDDREDDQEELQPRPPVVTIMGHVDHGKTSLLDAIRSANVTATEAGGITQHIGAYSIKAAGATITFLDTPGHEAFTSMRARGAQVTDIAILVVAADDGVRPQTIEAINHAKAADVPIIVAINKIDKPGANPQRVMEELTQQGLVSEDWGGDTIMVPVSAKTQEGLEKLMEMILLVAEVQELKANPDRKAKGAIIEAKLDRGRGPVATVLVQNGTLRVGDTIVAGVAYGRVRAMINDKGQRVEAAYPSDPVEVLGFSEVPEAGDVLNAVEEDKLSRQVAEERRDKIKAQQAKSMAKVSLDDLFNQIAEGQVKDLNIIVKADVQGSVEAVRQALEKLSNDEVRVRVIHGAAGAITETDIMLASVSNAIIIGFNVRADANAAAAAEAENVDLRFYRVIYNAIEDVEKAMKGLLAPVFKEVVIGHAQVRSTFKVSGVGTVAGCYVTDGNIRRNAEVRLTRDNIVIYEGKIDSLKRFKDDAKEVATGFECGIGLENFNDVKENDVIEAFIQEQVEPA